MEFGIPGITLGVRGPDGAAVTGLNRVAVGPQKTDAQGALLCGNLRAPAAGQHNPVTVLGVVGMTPTQGNVGKAVSADLTSNGSGDLNLDFEVLPGGAGGGHGS